MPLPYGPGTARMTKAEGAWPLPYGVIIEGYWAASWKSFT